MPDTKIVNMARGLWRGYLVEPMAVATGLCVIYLIMDPLSADHAAQTFRTELFEQSGPVVWNNYWFGGHYLPSYSLLSPALGAWIGFRLMGVLAVLGTVALFAAITDREWGEGARWGAIWFAAAATISLFSGRATFALGVFLAMFAVFAAQRGWRVPALFLAASVGLASPVAALFLACCGFSYSVARWPDRRGLEIAVVSFATAAVVALLFPGGGTEPYVFSSFAPAFLVTVLAAVLVPKEQKLIRTGLIIYGFALVLTFLVDTPMGGNVNRMGVLLIGPLFLCAISSDFKRHMWPAAGLTCLIVIWQVGPVWSDLRAVEDEPAVTPEFYSSLETTLAPRLAVRPARVEVLPVESHWESAQLALDFPLARGWERQTDRRYNGLFYRDRLDPDRYKRWLDRLAVGYVAVPRSELDYAGLTEAALIRKGLPYLERVPTAGPWRLYRVLDARPMVEKPAQLLDLTTDGFKVSSPAAGTFTVRIRKTPYWEVIGGTGCVAETAGGWTEVTLPEPGTLSVEARFRPRARLGSGEDCGR